MLSNLFGFLGVAVVVVAFLVLRHFAVRRMRRAMRNSRFGKSRRLQYMAAGVLLVLALGGFGFTFALAKVVVVLAVGLKLLSLLVRARSQPAGMAAPVSPWQPRAD